MELPVSPATMVALVRYYLRPVRNLVRSGKSAPAGTWDVRLGPVSVGRHTVVLRTPRLADGPAWCAARIAEKDNIEPWWVSSPQTWEQRHTEASWVSTWLHYRRAARTGHALPLIVEVDGQLAGQCGLESIDPFTKTGEMGTWIDSRVPGGGYGIAAGALMMDYAFRTLGLRRITAAVCDGNVAAANGCRRVGMVCEGTMMSYLDVGGRRQDHALWAITPDQIPENGLINRLARRSAVVSTGS